MAPNKDDTTVTVPNTLGKQVGLNVAWLNNHEFATFALETGRKKRGTEHRPQQAAVEINLMKPDFILADPSICIMVYECSRVFNTLQRRRYGLLGGQTQTIDFVKISQQYRSAIRQRVVRLNRNDALNDGHAPAVNGELLRMLYTIESVWHLLEFLILDSNASSGSVVMSMLEWIRYHFPAPEQQAAELLQQSSHEPDKDENYWPVMRALIVQGQTMVARTMLRMHTDSETRCFQVADQLLQSLPIYSVQDGLSVHKHKVQWQCWRDNVQMMLDTGNFGAEPQLEDVLRLAIGDLVAWRAQLRNATCWYEYLPGFLLYTDSSCRPYQLSQYANNWVMEYLEAQRGVKRADPELTFSDRLALAAMNNNLFELIMLLQQVQDNQWSAVHIVDLLYHAGLLETIHPPNIEGDFGPTGKSIRDELVYEFGCMLMSEGTYWLAGMSYLEYSHTEGLGAREALLARVPIRHEAQAMKLLAAARKNNFPDVVTEICKVLTKRNLASRRYDSALYWAIRSRDSGYVRDVANILLEHYCNHGELLCKKAIANLGSKIFISSRLVFLKKYYDFRQLYRKQEYAQAAELLVSLMDSDIVPSYFWPCLMADAIPLLEFKEPIIPSRETLIVLNHLQTDLVPMLKKRQESIRRQRLQKDPGTSAKDLQTNGADGRDPNATAPMQAGDEEEEEDETALVPKFSSNLLNNCTEELINLLRLACIRNLSRAHIIENSSND